MAPSAIAARRAPARRPRILGGLAVLAAAGVGAARVGGAGRARRCPRKPRRASASTRCRLAEPWRRFVREALRGADAASTQAVSSARPRVRCATGSPRSAAASTTACRSAGASPQRGDALDEAPSRDLDVERHPARAGRGRGRAPARAPSDGARRRTVEALAGPARRRPSGSTAVAQRRRRPAAAARRPPRRGGRPRRRAVAAGRRRRRARRPRRPTSTSSSASMEALRQGLEEASPARPRAVGRPRGTVGSPPCSKRSRAGGST